MPMATDIELRMVDPDKTGVGEIVVRHPGLFIGYFKVPEPSSR